jgi:hypothetical protein
MTASAGRTREAIELLGGAVERFSACGMELCAALARWRAGELTGGDGGAQLVHQASDVLERQAIASPVRFVSMWAPGFPHGQ